MHFMQMVTKVKNTRGHYIHCHMKDKKTNMVTMYIV